MHHLHRAWNAPGYPRADDRLRVACTACARGRSYPLHIQLSGAGTRADATLALYNSMGQRLSTQALRLVLGATNQVTIQTNGLATGVYILRLTGPGLKCNAPRGGRINRKQLLSLLAWRPLMGRHTYFWTWPMSRFLASCLISGYLCVQ
jgi:hypothetical protein